MATDRRPQLNWDVTPDQREIVEQFLSGSNVFATLPTDSGKSLCYWIVPACEQLGKISFDCFSCKSSNCPNERASTHADDERGVCCTRQR